MLTGEYYLPDNFLDLVVLKTPVDVPKQAQVKTTKPAPSLAGATTGFGPLGTAQPAPENGWTAEKNQALFNGWVAGSRLPPGLAAEAVAAKGKLLSEDPDQRMWEYLQLQLELEASEV
jgi:hypothetical protein